MTASQEFIQKVHACLSERPQLSWDSAWQLTRLQNPALYTEMKSRAPTAGQLKQAPDVQRKSWLARDKFQQAVNETMTQSGLSYHEAWMRCQRMHPHLVREMEAVNAIPAKAETTPDGQKLIPEWPVPPQVLAGLGLPLNATREAYDMYRAAERVPVTPEIAAKIIVAIIQYAQLGTGGSFDSVLETVRRHQPKMFTALKKV